MKMPASQTATTRSLTVTAPRTRIRPANDPALRLTSGTVVTSSTRRYHIGDLLGTGGFGAVYQITKMKGGKPLGKCVLKVTVEVEAWHREAYFGDMLRETPGVVRVHESFAWVPTGTAGPPLYCLVSEYVEGGALTNYLRAHPEPWAESKARREIIRLIRSLTLLHASGLVHRDITPNNVFVTPDRELKLGDFGIAAQRLGKQSPKANAFAPMFAPTAIKKGKAGAWLPADDVYHLGKLFALLLHGGEKSKLTPSDVKMMPCSPWAKSVIQRCIGERRKRFASAAEMLRALEKPASAGASKRVSVRSLNGKHVVFTGKLTMLRSAAAKLVKRAGGIPQARVSGSTDIVVLGDQAPNWKAEEKGQKLLDLDRERELGHPIAVISEKRFQNLVRPAPGK
jgi:serine/threonine-protein kinase